MHPKPAQNWWQSLIPGKTNEPYPTTRNLSHKQSVRAALDWGQTCPSPCWTDEAYLCRRKQACCKMLDHSSCLKRLFSYKNEPILNSVTLRLNGCFGFLVRALILPWQPQGAITLKGKKPPNHYDL